MIRLGMLESAALEVLAESDNISQEEVLHRLLRDAILGRVIKPAKRRTRVMLEALPEPKHEEARHG